MIPTAICIGLTALFLPISQRHQEPSASTAQPVAATHLNNIHMHASPSQTSGLVSLVEPQR
ncbi:TPA: hypothetical protein N0F65_010157 [Lagenidium giganteum]|uniref:Uncharacterized protein n=1 Tax=Lagenidium giganteum TaxID=4803 RepID=A0AAV2Z4Y8_9STRA|nr:TPA: hypothetical protein N0F65_010157 [Lagenidium giganteum]